jgi:hypothetical protein
MATAPTTLAYDAIVRRGPAAFAWEVLRRDPAYVADYRRVAAEATAGIAADPIFVQRWGAHFR